MKKLLLTVLAAVSFSAQATPETHAGIPTQPYVAQGTNLAYRVTFEGIMGNGMCSTGSQIAYVNKADDNYAVYVMRIEMAMLRRQTLTFYMIPTAGQCHIIEIQTS